MSIFGKIMFFVAMGWTLLVYMMYVSSEDFYTFMRDKIIIVILGYIGIIIFTIVMKRLVAGME